MAGTKSKSQELTERGKFWQKHLKAWSKTSLSQAEYCRRHILSQPAFGWWKKILYQKPRPLGTKQTSIRNPLFIASCLKAYRSLLILTAYSRNCVPKIFSMKIIVSNASVYTCPNSRWNRHLTPCLVIRKVL